MVLVGFGVLAITRAGIDSTLNESTVNSGGTGGVMFIAEPVIAAGSPEMRVDIGTQHRSGWLLLIGGVIAMVAAILPVMVHSAHKVSRTDGPAR